MVSEAAMKHNVSPRVEELAKPKEREDRQHRDAEWPVSITARETTPTMRTLELARPKTWANGYNPDRSAIWKVGIGPMTAVPSNRCVIVDCFTHIQASHVVTS